MKKLKNFLVHKDDLFHLLPKDNLLAKEFLDKIGDVAYNEFTSKINGGYFFTRSLQLYSLTSLNSYHSIKVINDLFVSEYKHLADGLIFFGQDIFGNQFGFEKSGIVFFNIETADRELIASNFSEWLNVIMNDLEYFTGLRLAEDWVKEKGYIDYNERLCPKMPFVLGGNYDLPNLYLNSSVNNIKFNSSIALQIHDLPDGADFNIIIKN